MHKLFSHSRTSYRELLRLNVPDLKGRHVSNERMNG